MKKYDHGPIEKKWRKLWAEEKTYETSDDAVRPKAYILDMFPYPSGEGLHVGHPKGYIATDVYSRHKRMTGHSVLHPMGWDAFGLPAENYAIKMKTNPAIAVSTNIARYKEQLEMLGFDYDWDREINTTDPNYYKWTQWIFLKLFEKGLAYQSFEPINWCPSCKTGLANEDLEGGVCERCGSEVEKKPMRQWVLRITEYADRMLEDLALLPKWPEHIKESQRNWIGKSEGAELEFAIRGSKEKILVFTTRPDTLFGATYMVLAPEHQLIGKLAPLIENKDEVDAYIFAASKRTEIERTAEGKEKTGVRLQGVLAVNPANKEEIPVYVADYVLGHYGTGAIMAVPAHDARDREFADIFQLPVKEVVQGADIRIMQTAHLKSGSVDVFVGEGTLVDSGPYSGTTSSDAKKEIVAFVGGRTTVNYKLRDWVFSRQRYWGEPIPVIHCEQCGAVPVPEAELPVVLPPVESYEPSGTGESPLVNIADWVNVPCPRCGGAGKRETNTMPQWAGSSWYYLRYMDPHNNGALVAPEKENYWSPVDLYVGGAEHATRHLIYARFWHKFLYDIGVVSTREPFSELHSVGLIMAEDGRKMSKRYGNVVNPDDIVKTYGADTLRVYEMFMGPFENSIAWNTDSMIGSRRFLERVWRLSEKLGAHAPLLERELQRTIKKVGDDIDAFKFNTAISQMMIFLNEAEKQASIGKEQWEQFLKVLAPFAPHVAEELWRTMGNERSIHLSVWPQVDAALLQKETITTAVQINGKVRAMVSLPANATEEDMREAAQGAVSVRLDGKKITRVVIVQGRLVNFVIED